MWIQLNQLDFDKVLFPSNAPKELREADEERRKKKGGGGAVSPTTESCVKISPNLTDDTKVCEFN